MAEPQKKAAKLPANRFGRSTPEEVSEMMAVIGRRGAAGKGVLRNVRAAAEPFGNTEELPAEAENGVVQSSSPPQLRPCGGNVEGRKPAVPERNAGKRAEAGEIAAEPLLTRVLYHEAMETGSAAKHGAKTAKMELSAPKSSKSIPLDDVRAAIAAIPSKLTLKSGVPFKTRLHGVGLTIREFAELTGTPEQTAKNWSRLNNAPPAAETILWLLEVVPDLRAVLEARK